MSFVHPETGVIMETREEFLAALADLDARMAPLWQERRALRNALADRYPAPEMPRPRERTAVQEKVARCPRCGAQERSWRLISAQCYHGEHDSCSMPEPHVCACTCHEEEKR